MEFIPVYLIFLPIIGAIAIYVASNKLFNYLIYVVQTVITVLSIIYYRSYIGFDEAHILHLGGWPKAIGVSLRNDNLSISFIFLSIFIWWMVIIYCWTSKKSDYKFLFFLLFLEGSFLALLQTNDFFTLYVLIEITTILSTILIIYKKDGESVQAGLYYLLFNSVGMLFFLIGIVLLYAVSGSLNMEITHKNIMYIRDTNVVKISFIFLMAAVGVKSALFPVFNWLPKAHGAAITSVSALLSGLLIKGGIYSFIRLNQVFNLDGFQSFFFTVGVITSIGGVIFALSQKDIKQILSFHTISQVGIILMGISFMEGEMFIGGVMHLFNHAMFKTLLFMAAGYIINDYGTKNITQIRGVFKNYPLLSIFMIIGMLSITGSPMFNGFVSKSIIKYGVQENNTYQIIIFIMNLGTSISFVKLAQIFFGKAKTNKKRKDNPNISLFILSMMCIVLGNYFIPITEDFLGVEILFASTISLFSWINYLVTLAIAYLIFKLFIEKDNIIIQNIRNTSISFENANFMLILYIFIMILWSKFV